MTWRDDLPENVRRRIEQVEKYRMMYGYKPDSDQDIIWRLAEMADTQEWLAHKRFEELQKTWKWKILSHYRKPNHYTCRLFRRIDYLIYWLKGYRPYWNDGVLAADRAELNSYFSQRAYKWAADVQNSKHWTRFILQI